MIASERFTFSRHTDMKHSLLALLLCSVLVSPLSAASAADEGAVALTLQGEAALTVPNDEAVLNFTKRSQKATAAEASEDVVLAANRAVEALKLFGDKVVVETTVLSTNPVYSKARDGEVPTPGAWRARETLRVLVKDVRLVSDVLSAVSKSMEYDGMSFRISDAARRARNGVLIRNAVKDALRQAETAAEALGKPKDRIAVTSLSIDDRNEHAVRFCHEAALMSAQFADNAAGAAPQVSAGTTDVSLSVRMTAKILP